MPNTQAHPLPHHEMILIKGGTFRMGSADEDAYEREQPLHEVELSDFYIGKYPVTQALWKAVMGADNNPSYFKGDARPVESVNWHETQDFIKKINAQTGQEYRLPTEAEWEYAARGGQKRRGYKYAGSNKLEEVGWYGENSYGENSHYETKAVGLKDPNELGLYDMSGNVGEWCRDWYDSGYYEECKQLGKVLKPTGPKEGTIRVLRGGYWFRLAGHSRSAYRFGISPEDRSNGIGFRLVMSLQSVG